MEKQQRKLILETMETMLEVQLRSIKKILGKEDEMCQGGSDEPTVLITAAEKLWLKEEKK